MMRLDIERGDNLFELIFELDRRLQIAQNHSSPLKNMIEAYQYLDQVLVAAHLKQPDVVDTVFLKLVDFFIKCQCNYKRQNLSKLLSNSIWIRSIKNGSEALKRLCQLWDQSVVCDFETCFQIINFLSGCKETFYNQTEVYGIFYEALNLSHTTAGTVFAPTTAITCSLYIQMLFEALKSSLKDEAALKQLIPVAKFASSILLEVQKNVLQDESLINEKASLEMIRIVIICSIIAGRKIPCYKNLPSEFSNLLIYFLNE